MYAADNGGVDDGQTPLGGNNWPLRGEKHTSWQGGVRVAAFVSGGLVPSRFRGTRSDVVSHAVVAGSTITLDLGAAVAKQRLAERPFAHERPYACFPCSSRAQRGEA